MRTKEMEQKRREALRWDIMRILDAGRPIGCNNAVIERICVDALLVGSAKDVKVECQYLRDLGLITFEAEIEAEYAFAAKLTAVGVNFVEYNAPEIAGIARPARAKRYVSALERQAITGRNREELDKKLYESEFSGYVGFVKWLGDKGFTISRSAFGRYARRAHVEFEKRMAAIKLGTEQARALVAADPDQGAAMSDAVVRLLQHEIFSTLMDADEAAESGDLAKLARAVASLSRATISQRRWSEEVRERLDKQKRAADGQIGEITREHGLPPEVAESMRRILLGLTHSIREWATD